MHSMAGYERLRMLLQAHGLVGRQAGRQAVSCVAVAIAGRLSPQPIAISREFWCRVHATQVYLDGGCGEAGVQHEPKRECLRSNNSQITVQLSFS